ncbi:MAG: hypothetical protein V1750_10110, partial [Acidobacteriota bacterium]
DDDLKEFIALQKTFADSPRSWSVDAGSIDQTTFDLSVKNPNGGEEVAHRSPQEIMDEITALDAESAEGDDLLRFASGAVHQTIYFPRLPHDIYVNPATGQKQPVPRHTDVDEVLARHIKRYLGGPKQ